MISFFRTVFSLGRRPPPQVTPVDPDELAAQLRRMVRPTLVMTPAKAAGFSKLGGEPELPTGMDWPIDGEACAFVLQVDLAELPAVFKEGWLPDTGRFYAFFDGDEAGAPGLVRICFQVDPPGPAAETPAGIPKRMRFSERRITFAPFTCVPSPDWLGLDLKRIDLSAPALTRTLNELQLVDDSTMAHRLGGYPGEIQGGQLALECEQIWIQRRLKPGEAVPESLSQAAQDWRPLLQVDSDPELGMNWWDGGRLYVFARAQDTIRGDFTKTVALIQSH